MRLITVESVMEAGPCDRYPLWVVRDLWCDQPELSIDDVARLGIPLVDRVWVLASCCMAEDQRRRLACDIADMMLSRVVERDRRSVQAVAVARQYADGAVDKLKLQAARMDAWAAGRAADWWAASLSMQGLVSADDLEMARLRAAGAWAAVRACADTGIAAVVSLASREEFLENVLAYAMDEEDPTEKVELTNRD